MGNKAKHGLLLLLAVAACSNPEPPTAPAFSVSGKLQDPKILEASGLARSHRQANLLWIINDDGAIAHAVDHAGARSGEFKLKNSRNRDWEDLASLTLHDKPYLMIADIGDNTAQRKHLSLYFVAEPDADKTNEAEVAWRVRYRYADGPRDAESAAVDVEKQRVLILSKRDLPPRLYAVPLHSGSDEVLTATFLGAINSLPRPSQTDVKLAPVTADWYWQPVGMDISADNLAAVILTYRALYYYERRPRMSWFAALNTLPIRISLGNFRNAEAVAFGDDARTVFVTGENKHSRLLRIDLSKIKRRTTSVTVMTFNVQNLFDNVDDPGKDDKAYLRIEAKQGDAHIFECQEIDVASWRDECLNLDWSDAAIDYKLTVLAASIRQVNDGAGADIVALQEVENISILNRLRTDYLGDLGYLPAILIEGTDARGIDVAFLSKFPQGGDAVLHPLELPEFPARPGDTRGVLQATFVLPDGSLLTGFSVHFPAPYHPTKMRVAAYQQLAKLLAALPDNEHAFAAGDFNTTGKEDQRERLLDNYARAHWTLAHDVGCEACGGTYFYRGDSSWSFLDMILFAPARGSKTTAQIRGDSVQIANRYPPQRNENGSPRSFRSDERTGVSDHWPLVATIEISAKQ